MNTLIAFLAQYLFIAVIIIAFVAFVMTKTPLKIKIAQLTLVSFPLAYVLSKILAHFISDPRPFIVERVQPLIKASTDNGFPSDHTMLSMTIALVLFPYNKKLGILLAALAVIVGIARVLAKVHHPLDIMGSIVIAALSVYTAWNVLKSKNVQNTISYYTEKLKNL